MALPTCQQPSNHLHSQYQRRILDLPWEAYLFSVRDNGVGFDSAQQERLFTLFERLHRPRDFKGQGLGLALVKRIVQQLHGQVWADSVLGEGAVFWVELPKHEVP